MRKTEFDITASGRHEPASTPGAVLWYKTLGKEKEMRKREIVTYLENLGISNQEIDMILALNQCCEDEFRMNYSKEFISFLGYRVLWWNAMINGDSKEATEYRCEMNDFLDKIKDNEFLFALSQASEIDKIYNDRLERFR